MSRPAPSPEWSRQAAALINSPEVEALDPEDFWQLRHVLDGDAEPDTLTGAAKAAWEQSGLQTG